LDLEPLSLIYNANYGWFLAFSRRYDEAIAHLKKTLELDENFGPTHSLLSMTYQLKGDYAASVEELAKALEIHGDYKSAALARESLAKGGWEGFLRYITGDSRPAGEPFPFYVVATFHAALGEKEKAFAALNKSYENREFLLTLLKVDPRLDPLRGDPRFQELLRKVGFPQ
jgi:tetratricopeptide (TPR) repeat protein